MPKIRNKQSFIPAILYCEPFYNGVHLIALRRKYEKQRHSKKLGEYWEECVDEIALGTIKVCRNGYCFFIETRGETVYLEETLHQMVIILRWLNKTNIAMDSEDVD